MPTSTRQDALIFFRNLRQIRTALQILTAGHFYRRYSNAAIHKFSCTITGSAYHRARKVSPCVRTDQKNQGLSELHSQYAPNVTKRPFLPYLFPRKGKDRAAGGTSETASTERVPAPCAKHLILCVRFLLFPVEPLHWVRRECLNLIAAPI